MIAAGNTLKEADVRDRRAQHHYRCTGPSSAGVTADRRVGGDSAPEEIERALALHRARAPRSARPAPRWRLAGLASWGGCAEPVAAASARSAPVHARPRCELRCGLVASGRVTASRPLSRSVRPSARSRGGCTQRHEPSCRHRSASWSPSCCAGSSSAPGRPTSTRFDAQLRVVGVLRAARPAARARSRSCDGRRPAARVVDGHRARRRARKACGNRREAVCPPCAERYRQDAYHLIAAGLRGGKGVPDSDRPSTPRCSSTLTAPSFGAGAHARRSARTGSRGAAGRGATRRSARTACGSPARAVHDEGDRVPRGAAVPATASTTTAAVMWNNTLGELWRLHDDLRAARDGAAGGDDAGARCSSRSRPAYVKVAEYQRRGLVHLHVLVRLDRAMPEYRADELRAAGAAVRRRAARARDPRGRRAMSPRPSRPSWAAGACAGATSSTSARCAPATSAARSPATSPSTRPRAPSRPAGCCTASTPTSVDRRAGARARPPLPAHRVRARRDRRAQRPPAPPSRARPTARRRDRLEPGARSAIRVRRAMGTNERVRVRLRDRARAVGRIRG